MSNVTVVDTKSELEGAIEKQNKTIVVKSVLPADDVKTVKSPLAYAFGLAGGNSIDANLVMERD
ncbi:MULTISPECIES: hypothetical protein [Idiomarina]|jgi:hypothetical protein|uniref:hypothetical protein n=1 Tax=Idiomarina TaxID=135575 RepID=UPI000C0A9486|nr:MULTISPECIES: hypothetical protein [Idiomarina]MAC35042.1 hypothetical protein [Haliea sp.]MAO68194.1 hypothetical protein [Idiomarina sp.]MBF79946.1 hypothetical protein [Idiomarina sp.]|tara:strand:+ start:13275 stop:13466 length:192 start_codon:yes stop_codon:yes gene_type:complete